MFSVVIPLWNKAPMIAATIESVLGQSYRDFELVVVDDGSSDGSRAALTSFADPRLRVISQPRQGPGAARNTGIESSHGDWIAFLDADDLWLADHLAELDRIRVAHPAAGLIGTSFVRSAFAERARRPPAMERRIEAIDFFEKAVSTRRLFCTSSTAIARSSYRQLGGFGPALWGQDTEYWSRIALARPVAISNQVTIVYRLATGGITDTVARGGLDPIRSIADIAPSVAVLIDRYGEIEDAGMRRSVDAYIDWEFLGCVRQSARSGDFRTLRSLSRVALRPPRLTERAILALALLPRPLARIAYVLGLTLIPLVRGAAERCRRGVLRGPRVAESEP